MYEWVLIFVVKTGLSTAAPMAGMPVIRYKTYAACKATAQKFNGPPRPVVLNQGRLAVCESLGNQKPDDEDDDRTPGRDLDELSETPPDDAQERIRWALARAQKRR